MEPNPYEPPKSEQPKLSYQTTRLALVGAVLLTLSPLAAGIAFWFSCTVTVDEMAGHGRTGVAPSAIGALFMCFGPPAGMLALGALGWWLHRKGMRQLNDKGDSAEHDDPQRTNDPLL